MGMKSNYKNSLYDMYLCEYQKNIKLQKEIRELELEIKNLIYEIDKLTNQVNKDSTNFGITTSNEIKKTKNKPGTNTYNHREKKSKKMVDSLDI